MQIKRLILTLLASTLLFLHLSAQTEGKGTIDLGHWRDTVGLENIMLMDSLKFHVGELYEMLPPLQQIPFQDNHDRMATFTMPSLALMPSVSMWRGACLTTYGQMQQMVGLMDASSGAVTLHQSLGRWQFSASAVANKYWMPMQHDLQTQFGIGGTIGYTVSDALSLHAFGYYYDRNLLVAPAFSPYVSTTSYGGYASIHLNDHLSTNLGVRRYVNPLSGRWTTEPISDLVVRFNKHIEMVLPLGGLLKTAVWGDRDNPTRFRTQPTPQPRKK